MNNISAPYRGHFSTSAVGGKNITPCYTTLTLTLENPEQDISDIRYIKYTRTIYPLLTEAGSQLAQVVARVQNSNARSGYLLFLNFELDWDHKEKHHFV